MDVSRTRLHEHVEGLGEGVDVLQYGDSATGDLGPQPHRSQGPPDRVLEGLFVKVGIDQRIAVDQLEAGELEVQLASETLHEDLGRNLAGFDAEQQLLAITVDFDASSGGGGELALLATSRRRGCGQQQRERQQSARGSHRCTSARALPWSS